MWVVFGGPRGLILKVDNTVQVTSAGAAVVASSTALTIPAGGSRLVKVSLDARYGASVANDLVSVAALVDGTQVTLLQSIITVAGGPGQSRAGNAGCLTLAPGAHTITVQITLSSGTGTGHVAEHHVLVEDVGLA